MPILQGPLKGKRWIVGSGNHGCWLGTYELETQRAFEEHVPHGGVVFDVGAHAGLHTLLASKLSGPGGKVYAFEPNPRNLHYLGEHLRINRVRNVEVLSCAVAERSGEGFFQEGRNSSTGHLATERGLVVCTVSLDECVESGRVLCPALIKIDVEGAEMLVLQGAQRILGEARPAVLLETHGAEMQERSLSFLKHFRYSIRGIVVGPLRETNLFLAAPW
jgi:FkbM family methyltransferase